MSESNGVVELWAQPRRRQESGFVNLQMHLQVGGEYYVFSHTQLVPLTGRKAGKVETEGMLFCSDALGQIGEGVYLADIDSRATYEIGLEQAKIWLTRPKM
jgi:hypothetical protein